MIWVLQARLRCGKMTVRLCNLGRIEQRQVAVNSEGKTNEATKQGKEPLKQGQDKPTAKQKEKQEKAQDKSLKADKPKKSRGMKM